MNAQPKYLLRSALAFNHRVLMRYLSDLSDTDLLVCPVPGAHHIAWQLGHLITSEVDNVLKNLPGASVPELPAGFAEQHSTKRANIDTPEGYGNKAQYTDLFGRVRQATLGALEQLPEEKLGDPTPGRMAQMMPTLGELFLFAANHELMHAGQFAVIRRKLGKPVVI